MTINSVFFVYNVKNKFQSKNITFYGLSFDFRSSTSKYPTSKYPRQNIPESELYPRYFDPGIFWL